MPAGSVVATRLAAIQVEISSLPSDTNPFTRASELISLSFTPIAPPHDHFGPSFFAQLQAFTALTALSATLAAFALLYKIKQGRFRLFNVKQGYVVPFSALLWPMQSLLYGILMIVYLQTLIGTLRDGKGGHRVMLWRDLIWFPLYFFVWLMGWDSLHTGRATFSVSMASHTAKRIQFFTPFWYNLGAYGGIVVNQLPILICAIIANSHESKTLDLLYALRRELASLASSYDAAQHGEALTTLAAMMPDFEAVLTQGRSFYKMWAVCQWLWVFADVMALGVNSGGMLSMVVAVRRETNKVMTLRSDPDNLRLKALRTVYLDIAAYAVIMVGVTSGFNAGVIVLATAVQRYYENMNPGDDELFVAAQLLFQWPYCILGNILLALSIHRALRDPVHGDTTAHSSGDKLSRDKLGWRTPVPPQPGGISVEVSHVVEVSGTGSVSEGVDQPVHASYSNYPGSWKPLEWNRLHPISTSQDVLSDRASTVVERDGSERSYSGASDTKRLADHV